MYDTTSKERASSLPRSLLYAALGSLMGLAAWVYVLKWAPYLQPWQLPPSRLATVTMGNPNHLGAYFCVGLPLFFAAGRWWIPAAFFVFPALLMTGSRLSLLATAAALLLGGCLQLLRRRWLEGLGVICLVGLLFAGSFVLSPQKNLRHLAGGWGGLSARKHLLRCAIPMLREHGVRGVGWGRFRQVFPEYRGRCVKGTKYQRDPQHVVMLNLHNDWLEVILEGGVIGLLLWLFLLWMGVRHLRQSQLSWRVKVWLAVVFVALAIQMAGHFPIQLPPVMALVLFVWVCLARRRPDYLVSTHMNADIPVFLRWCLLCVWGVMACVQWQSYRAEYVFVKADEALELGAKGAYELLIQSESYFPSVRVLNQKGQWLLRQRRPLEALDAFYQLMKWQPDAQTTVYMAEAYVQLEQYDEALKILQRGEALRPGFQPVVRILKHVKELLLRRTQKRTSSPTSKPSSMTKPAKP